jgi:hypothetical protein
MDPKRALLRHTCSTVAYRAAKALRDAPPGFATFKVGETTRTPSEILAHMGDVLEWALSMAKGDATWDPARPRAWGDELGRFFEALGRLDAFLKSEEALACTPERMF